jgi:hypothetical protein
MQRGHKLYYLTYPDERIVLDDTIESWFMDALANNEIGLDYLEARDPDTMAEALADMGFITLAHPRNLTAEAMKDTHMPKWEDS